MGNSALPRFLKLRGKTSIDEFNFIKVLGQKAEKVDGMKSKEITEKVDGMKSKETQK